VRRVGLNTRVTERGACNVIGGAFGVTLGALIEFGGVSIDKEICGQDQMKSQNGNMR
jgi:hypothetical protein